MALCYKFNCWGLLLAVGCNDSRPALFDIITRGMAKVIVAHVQPVVSLRYAHDTLLQVQPLGLAVGRRMQ